MADALVTLSSMFRVNHWNDVPIIKVQRLDRPAHVFTIEKAPSQTDEDVNDRKPWYYNIKQFLQNDEYPPGASNRD
jgi:hypothetical protein